MQADDLQTLLLKHQADFAPIIPFNPTKDKIIRMDFSSNNKDLSEDILSDTTKFTTYIHQVLTNAGARFGIGGYDEHRTVYSRSSVFDGEKEGDEPRRLHLGMDIWGKPNTAVSCPFEGIVHSFAYNGKFGDYGATIILTHTLENTSFHTLYGHLSFNSLKNLREGERLATGDIFAELGLPLENGHWPPHLHFQLIKDLQGWRGDYPGVCKYSEREFYLNNCPDPDLVIQLEKFAV
jgi:murein DD-endopeptidase MepM/ murein hydrolase activator NlpD